MRFGQTLPILRSFDEREAKAFYVGYLDCTVDFEHRFEPGLPLYMQVSRDGLVPHVSEHHGDASPGATVRIPLMIWTLCMPNFQGGSTVECVPRSKPSPSAPVTWWW